ncbi:hypothetical protein [Ethanoligenens sp.]|uniref:hypothetical protein n=1 Tax=Ethanoligenens sp. TaxID=2099655 RepID=UPI0039E8AF9C
MLQNVTVVCGMNGCGSTTFAAALAAHLAKSGTHTLLISPDTNVPAYSLWKPDMPPVETKKSAKSLGQLFAGGLTVERIAEHVYFPRGFHQNFGLLGYLARESANEYVPVDASTADDFLKMAADMSDWQIILDATHNGGAISTLGIQNAALIIRIVEPDLRGASFLHSRPPENLSGKTLYLACARSMEDVTDTFAEKLGISFAAEIPFLEEAHVKLMEGNLLQPYGNREYLAALDAVTQAVKGGTVS